MVVPADKIDFLRTIYPSLTLFYHNLFDLSWFAQRLQGTAAAIAASFVGENFTHVSLRFRQWAVTDGGRRFSTSLTEIAPGPKPARLSLSSWACRRHRRYRSTIMSEAVFAHWQRPRGLLRY
jgi:hypothetical protein